MEIIKKLDSGIKSFFGEKQIKKQGIIIILGIIGILLIFLSEFFSKNETDITEKNNVFSIEISENAAELENRLGEAVSKIKGAGKTEVLITFQSSDEYFYAKNSYEDIDENEKSSKNEYVIVEGKNGDEPVFLKKSEAKIRGVLVICEGGKSPLVCEKIIEAVCALLDIPSNKVSVAEMA